MNRILRKIPNIRLDTEQIMRLVDANRDIIGFPSLLPSTGYAIDREEALVITGSRGFLRIKAEDIRTLREELAWIEEEMERRSRD